MTDIRYDETKFGELLLYLAELSIGDRRYSRAKLAQQLFHCDFDACRLFGAPITGAVYRMQAEGPLADGFPDAIAQLRSEVRLVDRRLRHPGAGREQTAPTAIDLADLTVFDAPEIDLVRAVVTDLPNRPHGWEWVSCGEVVPYPVARSDFDWARPFGRTDERLGGCGHPRF